MKARNTLIGTLVVVIAVLIPATAAAKPIIDRTNYQPQQVRPDDRAGTRGAFEGTAGSTIVVVRPDDRAGIHGPGTPPPTSLVRSSDGFDWHDAFVGGLGGLGIALLLAGLLFLAASRRTRTRLA
jgi:hypothetical protein